MSGIGSVAAVTIAVVGLQRAADQAREAAVRSDTDLSERRLSDIRSTEYGAIGSIFNAIAAFTTTISAFVIREEATRGVPDAASDQRARLAIEFARLSDLEERRSQIFYEANRSAVDTRMAIFLLHSPLLRDAAHKIVQTMDHAIDATNAVDSRNPSNTDELVSLAGELKSLGVALRDAAEFRFSDAYDEGS